MTTFEVDCYAGWPYWPGDEDDDPNPMMMTEPEVVAHIGRCRHAHAIIHWGDPYFVVAS